VCKNFEVQKAQIVFVFIFCVLPSFTSIEAVETFTILPKATVTKNKVAFTLDIRTLQGETVNALPKLRPSGNQKPRYLYVWTFGDHSAQDLTRFLRNDR